ncbi:hypothetical protein [Streptomyces sp. NPDC058385]|uniref:hypothetical protein n=1 Tax=Streptomyces sp. NPDC058385 TaxID=3346473 RepID=UPI0036536D41
MLQQAAIATTRKVTQAVTGTDTVPAATAAAALITAAYAGEAITGFLADVLAEAQHDADTIEDLERTRSLATTGPRNPP